MKNNDEKTLVLVGIGELFFDAFPLMCLTLGKKPDFLYDNNKEKWGNEWFGVKCLTFDELLGLPRNSKVVFSTRLADSMFQKFIDLEFQNLYAFSFERSEARVRGIYNLREAEKRRKEVPLGLKSMKGSWCYVSGASRGIGAFVAEKLAERGVNLVIHSRTLDGLAKSISLLESKNIEIICCEAELSNSATLEKHCEWINQECPQVDFAYINAGVSPRPPLGDFFEGSMEGWMEAYKVNLLAPWSITRAFLNSSNITKGGKVFFVSSSIAGHLNQAAYSCSKAALNKMVNDLSRNAHEFALEFCLLDPGWIATDMGGLNAYNTLETLFPGMIFPACTIHSSNGSWISAQDYKDCSIDEAIRRAYHLGDLKEA